MHKDNKKSIKDYEKSILFLSFIMMAVTFYSTAWVSDDAYITFRVVDNLLHGFGPVWNLGVRVQVFTHPLWFILLSLTTWPVGDPYWASLLLSAICLAFVIFVIVKLADSKLHAALAIIALSLSKVFIDFSSSGLETPLSYALIGAMFLSYWKLLRNTSFQNLLATLLLGSLLSLNRFDLFLFALPVAVTALWRSRELGVFRLLGAITISAAPTLAWIIFSTWYYGSPLPNTFYAKLTTGIPDVELIQQGLLYLESFVKYDIGSFIIICFGLFLGLKKKLFPFAIGITLYVLYSIKVGGDFMVGRFYCLPVFLSFLILIKSQPVNTKKTIILILAIAIGIPSAFSTVLTPSHYSYTNIPSSGIANERGFYSQYTALRHNTFSHNRKKHVFARTGIKIRKSNVTMVATCYVGMTGYYAGRDVFIIDALALTDPLLARLPALSPWRVGHYERPIPKGYVKVIKGMKKHLDDSRLDKLWQDLYLAHRAPLAAPGRYEAIVRLFFRHWEDSIANSKGVESYLKHKKPSPFYCLGEHGYSIKVFARE